MLERDYSDQFQSLIHSLRWQINLPESLVNFFAESGDIGALPSDERSNQRIKVRTLGVLIHEGALPSLKRPRHPIGVYSKDFSRRGCGLLSPYQIYPQETVRILLPTLWLRMLVCRGRALGPNCYEVGGELIDQHAPDQKAFHGIEEWIPEPAVAS